VTVIQLLDAAEYRRDRSHEVDLAPLLHRLRGLPPPPIRPLWQQFRDDLLAFLAANQPGKVVLNFAGLQRIGNQAVISSSMNGVYASAKRLSDTFGCQWRICGLTMCTLSLRYFLAAHDFPQVHVTRFDAIAAFFPTFASDAGPPAG
jgi:hypothetical protein